MSLRGAALDPEIQSRLARVQVPLEQELGDLCAIAGSSLYSLFVPGRGCAADVLAVSLRLRMPVLFLDTGYQCAETYAYRD